MHLKENSSESSVGNPLLLQSPPSSYCFEIHLGEGGGGCNLFSCLPPQWARVWFVSGMCADVPGPSMVVKHYVINLKRWRRLHFFSLDVPFPLDSLHLCVCVFFSRAAASMFANY